jgi:hypothetical protein
VTHEEWQLLGYAEQWRAVVNTTIFKAACSVILEEIYRHRTTGDIPTNALQNSFKEGIYSAVHSLRSLADPPRESGAKIPKPWDKKEEEAQLPAGPKRPEGLKRE